MKPSVNPCHNDIDLFYHGLIKMLERKVRNTINFTVIELLELLESICTELEQFCTLGKSTTSGIFEHTTGLLDAEQFVVNS